MAGQTTAVAGQPRAVAGQPRAVADQPRAAAGGNAQKIVRTIVNSYIHSCCISIMVSTKRNIRYRIPLRTKSDRN